ncbi:hypothetical protein TYRP_023248 [Tyrophagus putrescentiae]|nr:hypothetical protein TYRP_023248 [Tyrophagus putrescentiae]
MLCSSSSSSTFHSVLHNSSKLTTVYERSRRINWFTGKAAAEAVSAGQDNSTSATSAISATRFRRTGAEGVGAVVAIFEVVQDQRTGGRRVGAAIGLLLLKAEISLATALQLQGTPPCGGQQALAGGGGEEGRLAEALEVGDLLLPVALFNRGGFAPGGDRRRAEHLAGGRAHVLAGGLPADDRLDAKEGAHQRDEGRADGAAGVGLPLLLGGGDEGRHLKGHIADELDRNGGDADPPDPPEVADLPPLISKPKSQEQCCEGEEVTLEFPIRKIFPAISFAGSRTTFSESQC